MRVKPRDSLNPKILQSPAAAASVTAAFAISKSETRNFTEKDDLDSKEIQVDTSQQHLSNEITSIREEKNALEVSLAERKTENFAIKMKIEEMNGSYAELSKELQSVQGQLVSERSRCAKLEAQIEVLESLPSLEEEIQTLRTEKSAFENDMENADDQKQRSGGIWKWVSR